MPATYQERLGGTVTRSTAFHNALIYPSSENDIATKGVHRNTVLANFLTGHVNAVYLPPHQ